VVLARRRVALACRSMLALPPTQQLTLLAVLGDQDGACDQDGVDDVGSAGRSRSGLSALGGATTLPVTIAYSGPIALGSTLAFEQDGHHARYWELVIAMGGDYPCWSGTGGYLTRPPGLWTNKSAAQIGNPKKAAFSCSCGVS